MDTKPSKSQLQHQQQQEQTSGQQTSSQAKAPQEFASVEDLLRFDANQVTPPPTIADKLKASLEAEPPPKRSWWQRFCGR
jgi:hypothetical protein